jgi:flagellar biogenesis protein FliO
LAANSVLYLLVFLSDLQGRKPKNDVEGFGKVLASFFLNLVVAIAGLIFSIVLVFKLRAEVKPYLNGSEDEWGFGQIVAILLLIVLLFLVLESISYSSEKPSDDESQEIQQSTKE